MGMPPRMLTMTEICGTTWNIDDLFVVATADPSRNFWAFNVGRTTLKQSSGIC